MNRREFIKVGGSAFAIASASYQKHILQLTVIKDLKKLTAGNYLTVRR